MPLNEFGRKGSRGLSLSNFSKLSMARSGLASMSEIQPREIQAMTSLGSE
jgi:hypothetical protein